MKVIGPPPPNVVIKRWRWDAEKNEYFLEIYPNAEEVAFESKEVAFESKEVAFESKDVAFESKEEPAEEEGDNETKPHAA
jgi:hypothetical protein